MKNSLAALFLLLPLGALAQTTSLSETCVSYALENSFSSIQPGEHSTLFMRCANENATPQRGAPRPKYSRAEIQFLQRAFSNIENCLDIPATETFPRLMMESGFHPTIQNPNGDTGIGQLTGMAIKDVDRVLPQYKDQIFKSRKSSCQWLKSFSQSKSSFWRPVGNGSRCQLMAKSFGHVKNMLYASILHKLNKNYVANEYEQRHIDTLLLQAGISDSYGPFIKELMVDLGYNTGGSTAVKNLQDFLLSRIDFVQRKTQELKNPVLFHSNKHRLSEFLGHVKPEDFDFIKGITRLTERRESIKAKLLTEKPKLTKDELEHLIGVSLRNLSASELSFPEWLKIWQSHGGPGYVTNLAAIHRRLDNQFGAGVCADSKSFKP